MPALGERFRAAREARGLSLSDVSEQIRIRSVYLAAIEDENWAAIGAPVYIRGFLKTYARFLGLDADEIVASFTDRPIPPAVESHEPPGRPSRQPSPPPAEAAPPPRNLTPVLWLAALVAVALIAFVVYNELTIGTKTPGSATALSSAAPSPTASSQPVALPSPAASESPAASPAGGTPSPGPSSSSAPSPSPVPSSSPGSGGPNTVQVVLSAPSWVRVTVDGNVSMEGTFPAGTSRLFHGKTARLRIGNAGGVSVYVDGKGLGKLGADGSVVERTFSL